MVREFSSDRNSNSNSNIKGSPPGYPDMTSSSAAGARGGSSAAPVPHPGAAPPPSSRPGGPAYHSYYHAPHGPPSHGPPLPPPSYDHERAAPPGPYTAAQYESKLPRKVLYHGGPPPPPPPPHARSPGSPSTSHLHGNRDPSHYHMHGEHTAAGYPPYREEHRAPPPPHSWHTDAYSGGSPPPPPRYYDSQQHASQHASPPPPPSVSYTGESHSRSPSQQQQHSLGPYRYSDPTLRREAVSRVVPTSGDRLNDVDGREGATSPSQIESSHREEVTTMGCTCKKTKCLKLYCQCFAVKIYCGGNCRCLVCHNTLKYDKERKDAIRNILSRNPSAFDTKFKKTSGEETKKSSSLEPTVAAIPLAHKLGCKCRKSACMKKYCECYAGNVVCSSNCRCVGCKNMPAGGEDGGPPTGAATTTRDNVSSASSSDDDIQDLRQQRHQPWMMNAAQNLAFLKHASPATEKPRRNMSSEVATVASMPSLSSETSPGERKVDDSRVISATWASKIPEPTSSEKTAVNALLMAAMAMTEMGSQTAAPAAPPATTSTPPKRYVTGAATATYETPPKRDLAEKFRSPKRKTTPMSTDRRGSSGTLPDSSPSALSDYCDDEDSPKREYPGHDETPSQHHKVKRSRIGSLRKGSHGLGAEITDAAKAKAAAFAYSTPKNNKNAEGKINDLTPVSARCIDFRKMHVNESGAPTG